jgi:hypothetical protein
MISAREYGSVRFQSRKEEMNVVGHNQCSMKFNSPAIFKETMFQSDGSGSRRKIQVTFGPESDKVNSIEFLNVRQISSVEVFHARRSIKASHVWHRHSAGACFLKRDTLAQARVPVPHN